MSKKKYLNQIYKITNLINNKVYIGLTVQGAKTRYLHHQYEARSGSNFPIHNSIRKYGIENFMLEVLDTLDVSEELKELEKFYISLYNSNNRLQGYNLTEGGDGTLGKYHSSETKNKIRLKALNRKPKEDTKYRMSESHCKLEAKGLPKRKEVSVYNLEGKFIGHFRSMVKAGNHLNIAHQGISNCILKNKYSYKGYIFRQIEQAA